MTDTADPLKTISADDLGRALRNFGVNLLCREPVSYAKQLETILGLDLIRADEDFALLRIMHDGIEHLIQLHADHTYAQHPLLGMLPEFGFRGAGIELRVFNRDPDLAMPLAEAAGWTVLQPPTDKPHGLRETFLVCAHGYCWVPSTPIKSS